METTGAARAKQLPHSASITIHHGAPKPDGLVEVAPDIGRVHFKNKDKKSYRIRFSREKTELSPGINIVLPPEGTITVSIRKDDEFFYMVIPFGKVFDGKGGGPIRN